MKNRSYAQYRAGIYMNRSTESHGKHHPFSAALQYFLQGAFSLVWDGYLNYSGMEQEMEQDDN